MDLTTIGALHTAVALVALICAGISFAKYGEIRRNRLGTCYAVTTALTAVTALFIFRHGGFGPGHVLAILTLIALAIGLFVAPRLHGKLSRYVEVTAFSTTVLFHLIPGVTETLVRVPVDAPFASGPTDPALRPVLACILILFSVGLFFQIRRIRLSAVKT
jgi:uncharacterized membrane protein